MAELETIGADEIRRNIAGAMEDVGIDTVIDAVGIGKVIDAVGIDTVIDAIGVDDLERALQRRKQGNRAVK